MDFRITDHRGTAHPGLASNALRFELRDSIRLLTRSYLGTGWQRIVSLICHGMELVL